VCPGPGFFLRFFVAMARGSTRFVPDKASPPLEACGGSSCTRSKSVRLAALIAVWYLSSLLTSLSTKEILRVFPYPVSLAAVQQAIAAVMGWTTLRTGQPCSVLLRDRELHLSCLPVATVMVVALVCYRWALMVSSVSFVHTVKTLGPVFTIAFSRLLLDERLPASSYSSVVPVTLGVALTSITGAEVTLIGFAAILLSTAGQALQSVTAKRLMRERGVGKGELFAMAALHAFIMLLPLSLLLDAWRIQRARAPLPPRARTTAAARRACNTAAARLSRVPVARPAVLY